MASYGGQPINFGAAGGGEVCFFFSSRRRHTRSKRDWSSDVCSSDLLAQGWKDRDGNPTNTPPAQADPLANYTKATFRTYLNSIFQLHTVNGIVEVTLQIGRASCRERV